MVSTLPFNCQGNGIPLEALWKINILLLFHLIPSEVLAPVHLIQIAGYNGLSTVIGKISSMIFTDQSVIKLLLLTK